jgi:hypothetical protein
LQREREREREREVKAVFLFLFFCHERKKKWVSLLFYGLLLLEI